MKNIVRTTTTSTTALANRLLSFHLPIDPSLIESEYYIIQPSQPASRLVFLFLSRPSIDVHVHCTVHTSPNGGLHTRPIYTTPKHCFSHLDGPPIAYGDVGRENRGEEESFRCTYIYSPCVSSSLLLYRVYTSHKFSSERGFWTKKKKTTLRSFLLCV